GVSEFVQRPLFRRKNQGFYVAQGNLLFISDVENQLFQLTADQHHVRAQGVDELARGILVNLHALLAAMLDHPAYAVILFHPGEFHHPTVFSKRVSDALVAISILHLHAADVGGNTDVIGYEDDDRVRVRIFKVSLDGGKFLGVRAAAIEIFDPADVEDL